MTDAFEGLFLYIVLVSKALTFLNRGKNIWFRKIAVTLFSIKTTIKTQSHVCIYFKQPKNPDGKR